MNKDTLKQRLEEIITNIAYDAGDCWDSLDNPYTNEYLPLLKQIITNVIGDLEPEYYDKEKKYKDHNAITRNNLRKEQRKRYETK